MRFPTHIMLMILAYSGQANANYKDDIAYTALKTELGSNLADGNSAIITQIEAASSNADHDDDATTPLQPVYLPDPDNSDLSDQTIIDKTAYNSIIFSDHASNVGRLLYGSNAMAAGSNAIHVYWADHWIDSGFLNYSTGKPLSSSSRIGNHSWVGSINISFIISRILKRIDWLVETDEFLQIVGTKNSGGTNNTLLSSAYNVLAVGNTIGNHGTGSSAVDATYLPGRTRTEIVAPFTNTSSSTPVVSAIAAVLIDLGHSRPGLSTDPIESFGRNRNGDIIYNAERSETIKAALLAGADRITQNTSTTANITDYRVAIADQTSNGLDARFGAGQVNAYNSYHIIAGGEQNSHEDSGASSTDISTWGFDYDPAFGGANNSNRVASYYFSTNAATKTLSASLVWHLEIEAGDGNGFTGTATFYDLDLNLYDITGNQTLLISSASQIDNSENIWAALTANKNYLLQVVAKQGQDDFSWDYALAWQLIADTDNDGIVDHQDNCPYVTNAQQSDIDNNGLGDACDNDTDGDGIDDNIDKFPLDSSEWLDADGDGIGDNSDPTPYPAVGEISVASNHYSAIENAYSVILTITRVGGTYGEVSVDFSSADDTATANNDYLPVNGSLIFADGETSKTIEVLLLDDAAYEGEETFDVALSNIKGGATPGLTMSTSITINENDANPADAVKENSETGFSAKAKAGSLHPLLLLVMVTFFLTKRTRLT